MPQRIIGTQHERFYQLKTATAELMTMPPLPMQRISRWMPALETCGSWNGGGTHGGFPFSSMGFDFIRYTVSG